MWFHQLKLCMCSGKMVCVCVVLYFMSSVYLLCEFVIRVEGCASMKNYQEKRDAFKTDSGVALIDIIFDDPFDMFNGWLNEAISFNVMMPGAFTFATSTHEGRVSARTIMLRRIEDDGFVILTIRNSQKTRDIVEVPNAAMVFRWEYMRRGKRIVRQVRVDVAVEELLPSQYEELYEDEPLYMKLQYTICQQGQSVEWHDTKDRHDALWMEVIGQGRELPMPDKMIGYKLYPEVMEFYYSAGHMIADRLVYIQNPDKSWTHHRLAA